MSKMQTLTKQLFTGMSFPWCVGPGPYQLAGVGLASLSNPAFSDATSELGINHSENTNTTKISQHYRAGLLCPEESIDKQPV